MYVCMHIHMHVYAQLATIHYIASALHCTCIVIIIIHLNTVGHTKVEHVGGVNLYHIAIRN